MIGATAEPLETTKRPPNTAIMMKMGNSQYFLRIRRNNKNSRANDDIAGPVNWIANQ
jgi:hypothetical protein